MTSENVTTAVIRFRTISPSDQIRVRQVGRRIAKGLLSVMRHGSNSREGMALNKFRTPRTRRIFPLLVVAQEPELTESQATPLGDRGAVTDSSRSWTRVKKRRQFMKFTFVFIILIIAFLSNAAEIHL